MDNILDNNYHNILQWNCQGVRSKTYELFDIVSITGDQAVSRPLSPKYNGNSNTI